MGKHADIIARRFGLSGHRSGGISNRMRRRAALGSEFKAAQEAKRLEKQVQARKLLAEWAARPGRTQEEVDKLNGEISRI